MRFLTDSPNLEFLKKQALALRARHRAKDLSILDSLWHYDFALTPLECDDIWASRFSIIDAQRIIAREVWLWQLGEAEAVYRSL